MDEPKPEITVEFAARVRQLTALDQIKSTFAQRLVAWSAYQVEQNKCYKDWRDGRERHFRSRKKGLRDFDAGPPEDGWVWKTYTYHIEARQPPKRGAKREGAGKRRTSGERLYHKTRAWCPPHLSEDHEPQDDLPLPLEPHRELTMLEQFAVLGALHDVHHKSRRLFPRASAEQTDDSPIPAPKAVFEAFCMQVPTVKEDDRLDLEAMFDAVSDDLKARSAVATNALQEAAASRSAAAAESASEDMADWKPSQGMIGAKSIDVPRSTLFEWAKRDSITTERDPRTKEVFYPLEWFRSRKATWRPRAPKH